MGSRLRTALALVVCVALVGAAVSVGASTDRTIDIENHSDIPEKTYSTKWGDYTVTEAKSVDPGSTVTIDTSVPGDSYHQVRLIDSDENQKRYDAGRGSQSYEFDLWQLPYGTYAVGLTNGTDTVYDVEPLIIRAYEIDIDAPGETTTDTVDVGLSLSEVASNPEDPTAVTVTVGNDSTQVTETATKDGETYEATLAIDQFSPGTYTLYATVEGDQSAFGHQEVIALSATEITFEKPTTETTTATSTTETTTATSTTETTTATSTTETTTATSTTETTTATSTTETDGSASGTGTPSAGSSSESEDTATSTETSDAEREVTTTATAVGTGTVAPTQTTARSGSTPSDDDGGTASNRTTTDRADVQSPGTDTADESSGANVTDAQAPLWSGFGVLLVIIVSLLWTRSLRSR